MFLAVSKNCLSSLVVNALSLLFSTPPASRTVNAEAGFPAIRSSFIAWLNNCLQQPSASFAIVGLPAAVIALIVVRISRALIWSSFISPITGAISLVYTRFGISGYFKRFTKVGYQSLNKSLTVLMLSCSARFRCINGSKPSRTCLLTPSDFVVL